MSPIAFAVEIVLALMLTSIRAYGAVRVDERRSSGSTPTTGGLTPQVLAYISVSA